MVKRSLTNGGGPPRAKSPATAAQPPDDAYFFPEESRRGKFVIALCACLIVVGVYGAIPFYSLPDLGQVIWTSGFALSFANSNWSSLRAEYFGYPAGAPMVFGLPTGLVQSVFIKLFGLHAGDAYALTAILFLCIAVIGCISLARLLGASYRLAALFAVAYLTLPVVWWHASFSSISFGFAFLPLYLSAAFRMMESASDSTASKADLARNAFLFCVMSLIATFMDGYTGVMFFVASGIIWVCEFGGHLRDGWARAALAGALMTLSAGLSYKLYTSYVGVSEFERVSMDFFRGWGVDLVMIAAPTKGIGWLFDALGLSVPRSEAQHFGDGSVWATSFALVVMIGGAFAYWRVRRHRRATPLLLISLAGFYFCLGPSLKVNSLRPPVEAAGQPPNPLMPPEAAVGPTGSEVFSKYVPGFKNMRASYRWIGLLFAGGLALITLAGWSSRYGRFYWFFPAVLLVTIVFNLPSPSYRYRYSRHLHIRFDQLEADLLPSLQSDLPRGAKVAFVPPGNDFLVNYLAAKLVIYSPNAGGDKNEALARQHWPASMLAFRQRPGYRLEIRFEDCLAYNIRSILLLKDMDRVVVPLFDPFFAAFSWPWDKDDADARRLKLEPIIKSLEQDERLSVDERPHYFSVSRRFEREGRAIAEPTLDPPCGVFGDGWYGDEGNGRWSAAQADLSIPLNNGCKNAGACAIRLVFHAYVPQGSKPKRIEIHVEDGRSENHTLATMAPLEMLFHVEMAHPAFRDGVANLSVRAPDAVSPKSVGMGDDPRVLGIFLREIQILPETTRKVSRRP